MGAHGCAMCLQVVLTIKGKGVLGQYLSGQFNQVFRGGLQLCSGVQHLPASLNSIIMWDVCIERLDIEGHK